LSCINQSVVLNGTAIGGSPFWTGPGINAGNENQVTPTVTQPGIYVLTVTSPENCIVFDSVVVAQDPSSVTANAGPNFFFSCEIDTVTLQGSPTGPGYTYLWTGPGINAGNQNLPNPIILVPGLYSLVVTDVASQCVSLPDTVLIVDITTNIVAIIQDPNSLDCFSTFIDLDATGSSVGTNIVYLWFNEDGDLIGNTSEIEISSGGMFMFTVLDTISGCFDSTSVFVEDLTAYPPINAGANQELDCNHTTVVLNEGAINNLPNLIFQWTGPAGGILSPDTLLSVVVGTPGLYFLTATDTVSGCSNYDSVLVDDLTLLPFAEIVQVESITCIDPSALLNVGLSSTGPEFIYTWSGPDFNNVVADQIEPEAPGQYILTVMNELTGCTSYDTILLSLPMLPTDLLASVTLPVCEGDPTGTITVNNVTGGTPVYMYSIDGGPSHVCAAPSSTRRTVAAQRPPPMSRIAMVSVPHSEL
jgi:hypothetical protein